MESKQSGSKSSNARRHTAGFSLLEVLISLVILSVGLLGIAGLMSTTLKSNDSAYMQGQATVLAYNIVDRMRANTPAVTNGGYDLSMPTSASTATVPPAACTGSGADCTSDTLAIYDTDQWEYELATKLPEGRGSITTTDSNCPAPSNCVTTVTIKVLWNDSRANQALQGTSAPTASSLSVTSAI